MPITKHNFLVTDPAEIARTVAEAFYIAKPMPADHLERWLTEAPWVTGDVPVPVRAAAEPA